MSKEYGSCFVDTEIKLFSEAIPILLANGKMSTHDFEELKISGISGSKAGETLEKLEDEGWLQREEETGVLATWNAVIFGIERPLGAACR